MEVKKIIVLEKLDSIVDNQNNPLTVWHGPLNNSKCYTMVLETLLELEKKKWVANSVLPESWRYQVVYAENTDKQVVGGIVYDINEEINQGWIYLSFVGPEFRGRRINELLHPYVEKLCKDRKCIVLSSHVHVDNQPRLNSATRADFKPEFYLFEKKLITSQS